MKKLFFSILVLSCLAPLCQAQDKPADLRRRLIVGGKVGMNLSNVYDEQGGNLVADAKLGFVGGGFVSIPIGPWIGIQPEVLFSQKGYQGTGYNGAGYYSYSRTSNYLDVPVYFAFKPIGLVTILAGPQFSYLMRQTDSYVTSNSEVDQERQYHNNNPLRNTLCFSGGADLNLGHFVFGARAGWDVQHNHGDGTYTDPRYKNVWYQATVGLRFY
ncbi:MAG TPA: porin family protein [Gammaproteobacteria bacterium]|nr:porin family protein [Gammaproteobacteria bacterium]